MAGNLRLCKIPLPCGLVLEQCVHSCRGLGHNSYVASKFRAGIQVKCASRRPGTFRAPVPQPELMENRRSLLTGSPIKVYKVKLIHIFVGQPNMNTFWRAAACQDPSHIDTLNSLWQGTHTNGRTGGPSSANDWFLGLNGTTALVSLPYKPTNSAATMSFEIYTNKPIPGWGWTLQCTIFGVPCERELNVFI